MTDKEKWTEKVGLHSTHGQFEMKNVDMHWWGFSKVFVSRLVFHFVPEHWDGDDGDPRWSVWGVNFFGFEVSIRIYSRLMQKMRGKSSASYRFGDAPDP